LFLREKEFKLLKILGEKFLRRALGSQRPGKSYCREKIEGFKGFEETKPSDGYTIFDNIIEAWECRFDEWVMRPRWLRVKEYARMMQEAHGLSEMI
jgi:hypothetical protein